MKPSHRIRAFSRLPEVSRVRLRGNLGPLVLFIFSLPAAAYAAPQFDVHGRQVTVTTERYRVVVDGLAVVQIENRLTGEVYARSGAEPPSASMRQMLGNQGVLSRRCRPRPRLGPRLVQTTVFSLPAIRPRGPRSRIGATVWAARRRSVPRSRTTGSSCGTSACSTARVNRRCSRTR